MRPIDQIRNKIDSDFTKYHPATLCQIRSPSDIKSIKGVGIVSRVYPINKYSDTDLLTVGEDKSFIVLIVNRTPGNIEKYVEQKNYVVCLNLTQDASNSTLGFLVSKSFLNDLNQFVDNPGADLSSNYSEQALQSQGATSSLVSPAPANTTSDTKVTLNQLFQENNFNPSAGF